MSDGGAWCRPSLRVPPPVTVEGKPVEPLPEKSFIQKYWIYMVVALFALGKIHPVSSCTSRTNVSCVFFIIV